MPGAQSRTLSEHSVLAVTWEGSRGAGVGGSSRVAGSWPPVDGSHSFPGQSLCMANE